MKHNNVLLTLLILAGATFDCIGQRTLIPARNLLGSQVIRPERQSTTWYLQQDTSRRAMATITTTIQPDYESDKILIIQAVAMKGATSAWIDSTVAMKATLAPVYHSSTNGQRDMVLRFTDRQVSGYYTDKRNQTTVQVQDQFSRPCFDSNLYPHLIRFLPLQTGYQALLPIYDYNPKKHGLLFARIVAVTETVLTSNGQKTPCYVVQVSDDISPESQATYYVAKADRTLLKSELQVGGRRMLIE